MFQAPRRLFLTCQTVVETSVRFRWSWRDKARKGAVSKKKIYRPEPGTIVNDTIDTELQMAHEVHNIIKWRMPEKWLWHDPRRTGDLEPLPPVDPNWIKLEYQPFAEQINALPEETRKWFTVGFGRRREGTKVIYDQTFKQVRRHKWDGVATKSPEWMIAWATIRIRDCRLLFIDPKFASPKFTSVANSRHKRKLWPLYHKVKMLVDKRRKYLNDLRHKDYKRFEWLIEELGLLFVPTPEIQNERIVRKKGINRLTDLYCEELIAARMKEYKVQLEEEKVPFLEGKLSILQEIQGDEEAMGLTSSVAKEIEETIKRLENLKRTHLELKPLEDEQETPVLLP